MFFVCVFANYKKENPLVIANVSKTFFDGWTGAGCRIMAALVAGRAAALAESETANGSDICMAQSDWKKKANKTSIVNKMRKIESNAIIAHISQNKNVGSWNKREGVRKAVWCFKCANAVCRCLVPRFRSTKTLDRTFYLERNQPFPTRLPCIFPAPLPLFLDRMRFSQRE